MPFSWFKKKPESTPYQERVWVSSAARYAGIDKLLIEAAAKHQQTLLIAHFPDTLKQCCLEMEFRQQSFLELNSVKQLVNNSQAQLFTILSENLLRMSIVNFAMLNSDDLQVLILEHYPLPFADERLLSFLQIITTQVPIYCLSLEDPFLQRFRSNNIIQILKKMGAEDNEYISHSMVKKAIANAQQKIAAKVLYEILANSAEEWIQKNFPLEDNDISDL